MNRIKPGPFGDLHARAISCPSWRRTSQPDSAWACRSLAGPLDPRLQWSVSDEELDGGSEWAAGNHWLHYACSSCVVRPCQRFPRSPLGSSPSNHHAVWNGLFPFLLRATPVSSGHVHFEANALKLPMMCSNCFENGLISGYGMPELLSLDHSLSSSTDTVPCDVKACTALELLHISSCQNLELNWIFLG